jgi:hypothetical protein
MADTKTHKIAEMLRNAIAHRQDTNKPVNYIEIAEELKKAVNQVAAAQELDDISINFSGNGLNTLKSLKNSTGAEGYDKVIQDALSLYKSLLDYNDMGYKIRISNGNDSKELIIKEGAAP